MKMITSIKNRTQKTKKQATKKEIEARINEIIELILDGEPNVSIVKHMSNKHHLSERQIYRILEDAKVLMTKGIDTNLYFHYAKSLEVKKRLFQKAMAKEDYRLAFDIQKDIDDKTGVTRNAILIMASMEFNKLLIEIIAKNFIQINELEDKSERFDGFMEAMRESISQAFKQATPEFDYKTEDQSKLNQPTERDETRILESVL